MTKTVISEHVAMAIDGLLSVSPFMAELPGTPESNERCLNIANEIINAVGKLWLLAHKSEDLDVETMADLAAHAIRGWENRDQELKAKQIFESGYRES
jgi:hypothetical protein